MGQLGDMFPGAKLRKDTPEEEGSGQGFQPGPLDLDNGVVYLRKPESPVAEQADQPAEDA